MGEQMAVWWLAQADYEALDETSLDNMPAYIQQQFLSRQGRPGQGRVWAADEFPDDVSVSPWPQTALAKAADRCGGIVIWLRDADYVAYMPGFVTDMELNLLRRAGDAAGERNKEEQ